MSSVSAAADETMLLRCQGLGEGSSAVLNRVPHDLLSTGGLMFCSWNQATVWLLQLDGLRRAA
jgi:hypothetical protein